MNLPALFLCHYAVTLNAFNRYPPEDDPLDAFFNSPENPPLHRVFNRSRAWPFVFRRGFLGPMFLSSRIFKKNVVPDPFFFLGFQTYFFLFCSLLFLFPSFYRLFWPCVSVFARLFAFSRYFFSIKAMRSAVFLRILVFLRAYGPIFAFLERFSPCARDSCTQRR